MSADEKALGGQPSGEEERFSGLDGVAARCFDDHHRDVFRYALRRTEDEWAAEDVVAEVFAVAWRRPEKIPDESLPWLYGVARRVISNQMRSERRITRLRASLRFHAGTSRPHEPSPHGAVERSQLVKAALAKLSERDRQILMLVAWEALNPAAAAHSLGCSRGAFKVRLLRARRRFEEALRAQELPGGERDRGGANG